MTDLDLRANASSFESISTFPQDKSGNVTEIAIFVPPCPEYVIIDETAAVMLTSHLGRPTEGEFKPRGSLDRWQNGLRRLLGSHGAGSRELDRRRASRARAKSCCWKTAASTKRRGE